MKFVLVGDIEFIDGTAYVRKLKHALEVSDMALNVLDELGVDYLLPHHYPGKIVFDKFAAYDAEEERQQAIQDEYREDELRERAERKEEFGY